VRTKNPTTILPTPKAFLNATNKRKKKKENKIKNKDKTKIIIKAFLNASPQKQNKQKTKIIIKTFLNASPQKQNKQKNKKIPTQKQKKSKHTDR
jgi:hypothetical protein